MLSKFLNFLLIFHIVMISIERFNSHDPDNEDCKRDLGPD